MPFRFPHREPKDATELFQWLRELLPELEIKVLENCEVGTASTTIAHGMGMVPFFVRCSTPHCLALVRQVKKADNKNVYLRATNPCVVDVFVAKVAQLAQLTTSIKNGGFHYPDWDPLGHDDHKVMVDGTDALPEYLKAKLADGAHITFSVVTVDGVEKVQANVTWPTIPDPPFVPSAYPGPMRPVGDDYAGDPAVDPRYALGPHGHPPGPAADPETVTKALYPAMKPAAGLKAALCMLAPMDRWTDVVCVFKTQTSGGGEWAGLIFGGAWTQGPAGTWTCNTEGDMPFEWFDGLATNEGGPIQVGTHVLAVDPAVPVGATEGRHYGLYEVLDLGWHYVDPANPHVTTHAQLRRVYDASVPDDFTFGKPVHVTSGSTWAGHTFRYNSIANPTLGLTDITFYDAGTSSIYEAGYFGLGSQWVALDGAAGGLRMWRKINETMGGGGAPGAPIHGIAAGGGATFPIPEGGKFLLRLDASLDVYNESQHFGVFELVSTFSGGSSPTIRRVDYANEASELTGLIVQITGAGASGEGNVYTQIATIASIDNDPTTWTVSTEVPQGTPELLTGTQIASEGATGPFMISNTGAAGDASLLAVGSVIVTLPGTPGGITFPAARTDFAFESLTISGCTGEARIEAYLSVDPSGVDIVCGYSAPYGNGTFTNVTFQAVPAAPVSMSPSDRLALLCCLRYTSSTPVTVAIKCGSPWGTKIGVPFDLAVSGANTGRHQDLSQRDQDVADADPVKADPCHLPDSIGAGFLHTPFQAISLAGGHWMGSPANNQVLLSNGGSSQLHGIGTLKKTAGDIVDVTFLSPTKLVHASNETVPADHAALALSYVDGVGQDIDWLTPGLSNCVARFQLRTDTGITPHPCWCLVWMKEGNT